MNLPNDIRLKSRRARTKKIFCCCWLVSAPVCALAIREAAESA
jgi:hypothetical protein